jgi:Cytokinin dehydrogenase 1, FAD and cytokinin binding
MIDGSNLRWLVKCAFAAASVLLLCAAAKPWLPRLMQAPTITVRDNTLFALNRYISEPTPDVVLLGSSLTARIKEEYFVTLRVGNLGLPGGSPLTGLRIVLLNPQSLPKTILVETNLLANAADETLVEKFSTRGHDFFFRPVRMAHAAYENWRHAPVNRVHSTADADRILKEPPQAYNNQVYFERAVKGYGQDASALLQKNVDQLAELTSIARGLGARVLLFELPYADQLDQTRLAQDTRRIALGRFSDPHEWLHLTIANSELRWPDGAHLDERSAILAARAIEQAIGERAESPR